MSTENQEARETARTTANANPNTFLGVPVPIWLVLIPALSGIVGNYLGHESGKAAAPDNQINMNRVYGEIKVPTTGQTVGDKDGKFECSGTAEGLTPGLHLWLAVERNGFIWPKEDDFKLDSSGNWKQVVTEQGKPDEIFTVTLFVANDEAHAVIKDWLRTGKETNVYPQMPWIRGLNRLDRIDRLHTSH